MRRDASGRRDRVLAAIEIPALGVWLGALVGFAFISAPLAFHLVAPLDVTRFAGLIAATIGVLATWGYVLGGIAIAVGLARASFAGDRVWDAVRIVLVALALVLTFYHQHAIVPAMAAVSDVTSPAYHALHAQSTQIYGAAVILVLAALVLAAARRDG